MTCPKCGGHIEFPREGVGEKILCPHCESPIWLSNPLSRSWIAFVIFGVFGIGTCAAIIHGLHQSEPESTRSPITQNPDETSATTGATNVSANPSAATATASTNLSDIVAGFRARAERGEAKAQFNLGVSYDNGLGVAKDYVEAVKWYRKAAEQGYRSAQYNLGVKYENGQGASTDPAEAVQWYRKAAEQGEVSAQFHLGAIYQQGSGLPQNDEESAKWN